MRFIGLFLGTLLVVGAVAVLALTARGQYRMEERLDDLETQVAAGDTAGAPIGTFPAFGLPAGDDEAFSGSGENTGGPFILEAQRYRVDITLTATAGGTFVMDLHGPAANGDSITYPLFNEPIGRAGPWKKSAELTVEAAGAHSFWVRQAPGDWTLTFTPLP